MCSILGPIAKAECKKNALNDSVSTSSQRTRLKRKPRVLFSQVFIYRSIVRGFSDFFLKYRHKCTSWSEDLSSRDIYQPLKENIYH